MLCRNCQKNQATTHIKRTVNGHTEEFYLCGECAEKLGFTGFNPFSMSDLWGSLFSANQPAKVTEKHCEKCGSTFSDIVGSGKMGCANCYSAFYDRLLPSLQKIHGKSTHIGNVPGSIEEKPSKETDKLKEELNLAIENEEYEKAAEIRDKIKKLGKDGEEK